ncbi:GNAT family N-acetyltransferase [Neiella marina]|uniref:GNAT family N-acetyltransferase n=1 Tax=Neiella holothuriorum TaxID=2870530 RepID=A0ABS7EJC1_9GAMM|nr:GNAT family N-acetyltransferase [Neiella holothuriorum]MBW8192453.1 GNAT family N-acetyltransferase [Neiella holothuriorum]
MHIELTTQPPEAELKILSKGIQSYNSGYLTEQVATEPDTRFAVFARNNQGIVVGGIRANAYWNYCIIELLWLASEARGQRIGSQLIHAAEAHAKSCGFEYVRTETLDIQAKPFYQKLGYNVFGELPDYPKGHTTYCLIKKL